MTWKAAAEIALTTAGASAMLTAFGLAAVAFTHWLIWIVH